MWSIDSIRARMDSKSWTNIDVDFGLFGMLSVSVSVTLAVRKLLGGHLGTVEPKDFLLRV